MNLKGMHGKQISDERNMLDDKPMTTLPATVEAPALALATTRDSTAVIPGEARKQTTRTTTEEGEGRRETGMITRSHTAERRTDKDGLDGRDWA